MPRQAQGALPAAINFGEFLGDNVLANLGLAQNVSVLAAMGLFMWLRGSKGVQAYAVTIGAALALMFTYAVCISVVVALNVDLPAGALYFLVVCMALERASPRHSSGL